MKGFKPKGKPWTRAPARHVLRGVIPRQTAGVLNLCCLRRLEVKESTLSLHALSSKDKSRTPVYSIRQSPDLAPRASTSDITSRTQESCSRHHHIKNGTIH